MALEGTAGQILFNESLPREFRSYGKTIGKKELEGILQSIAEKQPGKYKSTLVDIKSFADRAAYVKSGLKFSDFSSPIDHRKIIGDFEKTVSANASDEEVRKKFTELQKRVDDETFSEGLKRKNLMAMQVASGSRGNPSQLASTISSPVLYADNFGKPIRVPVKNSFSEGLTPTEYWGSTYGTRRGVISTKFATPKGGYFGKQLGYVMNDVVVTTADCGTKNGIDTSADDPDNIGRVLAMATSGFPAGTTLTPELLTDIKKRGATRFLIRSPITCEAESGVCQKCRGFNENGRFPEIGSNVGQNSAHALSESSTQAAMKEKHTGGQVGTAGKDLLGQLTHIVRIPKIFTGGAVVSKIDGTVKDVSEAPQGGYFVKVEEKEHYVLPGFNILVKPGDTLEAGQALSDGIVNPADVTKLRGIGEGRKHLADTFRATMLKNNLKINKVHSETLARSMINLAQVEDNTLKDDTAPGDIISFSQAQKRYSPDDRQEIATDRSVGKFLTKQYLHFTAGTQIKPSMVQMLKQYGIDTVEVSDETPPFSPIMVRIDDTPGFKSNWVQRMFSSQLKKKIIGSAQKTEDAPIHGLDFIPSYVTAREFGKPKVGY
jgi:DNA-directed RNA polymerase subunit beta'